MVSVRWRIIDTRLDHVLARSGCKSQQYWAYVNIIQFIYCNGLLRKICGWRKIFEFKKSKFSRLKLIGKYEKTFKTIIRSINSSIKIKKGKNPFKIDPTSVGKLYSRWSHVRVSASQRSEKVVRIQIHFSIFTRLYLSLFCTKLVEIL